MNERKIIIDEKQIETYQLNRILTENEKDVLNRVGGSIEWVKEEMYREFAERLYQTGALKVEQHGDKFVMKLTVIKELNKELKNPKE